MAQVNRQHPKSVVEQQSGYPIFYNQVVRFQANPSFTLTPHSHLPYRTP